MTPPPNPASRELELDADAEAEREPVHDWFGLTYANYLVLPRSLLQSMPEAWQARFVACLDELREEFSHVEHPGYVVSAVDKRGRFIRDPVPHYNRGRTRVDGLSALKPAALAASKEEQ